MTIRFYQHNAKSFFNATVNVDMTSLYRPFIARLPPQGRVLDAGCGSGRDSRAFKALGFEVTAFDASAEMVALATEYTGLPVQQRRFEDVSERECYDGIWSCASLLHVPASGLPAAMHRLADALKPGGVWYLSFKYGSGERVKEGRHFTDLDEEGLTGLLAAMPQLSALAVWQTRDKRPERDEVWLNGLLQKSTTRSCLPL
ncbi:TPA: class I SAM-dependent methyltransferase [Pluralibacter gergoviae]